MKIKISIIAALLLTAFTGFSQTILFQEHFETSDGVFTLNSGGVGTNTGTNEWIINGNYTGAPSLQYPNTVSQLNTAGGGGISNPNGHYLHVYDVPSTYTNCNYNPAPANASDRFANMTSGSGVCTFGYDNVQLSFYYLCQGSATAYGNVYYSAENGPWIQLTAPLTNYFNQYNWQQAVVSIPAFNNISSLRFGFRWQNNAGSAGFDTSGFAIDDIYITGTQNTGAITITATPSPTVICADGSTSIDLTFTQTDSLCDGNYSINLEDGSGNVVAGWTANSYAPITNGPYLLTIPNTVTGTACYYWVVDRTTPPNITSTRTAVCFEVENCPNSISTQEPAALMDPSSPNTICAGSTMFTPFFSSGTYGNTNVYTAQLSDSAGQFPTSADVIGSLVGNASYPAANGAPGNVLSFIPDSVPQGCNYYIRVVSDAPNTVGSTYGPFCVVHCDGSIQIPAAGGGGGGALGNAGKAANLLACIKSCYRDPGGFNATINYTVNSYASNVTYGPGNQFQVQLLSTSNLSPVNTGGLSFGATTGTTSGTLNFHVPCADSICTYASLMLYPAAWGGYGGNFYMRLIATNSQPPDSNVGPLVLLTIGYPNDSLAISPAHPTVYCVGGSTPTFEADPLNTCTWDQYNTNTSYAWFIDNNATSITGPGIGITTPPAGTYTVMAQEDNNGCYGPLDTLIFSEDGPPTVSITGPTKVCVGDTGTFNVPFTNNTVYFWSNPHIHTLDTANNRLHVRFDSLGTYIVKITASDTCGFQSGTKTVKVIQGPTPTVTGPLTECPNSPFALQAGGGSSYTWTPTTGLSCTTCANPTAIDTANIMYKVGVSNGVCTLYDSVTITVKAGLKDTACCDQTITRGQSASISVSPGSVKETYSWSSPSTLSCSTCMNPIATPSTTTRYYVTSLDTATGCSKIDSVLITIKDNCGSQVFVPDAFSPNGDGENDILYVRGQCLTGLDFKVFDRWGNKVFETNNVNQGWDGRFNGAPMNTGTYVYYVSGTSNETPPKAISMKGNVTLVR